jgi:hypothetical protein
VPAMPKVPDVLRVPKVPRVPNVPGVLRGPGMAEYYIARIRLINASQHRGRSKAGAFIGWVL